MRHAFFVDDMEVTVLAAQKIRIHSGKYIVIGYSHIPVVALTARDRACTASCLLAPLNSATLLSAEASGQKCPERLCSRGDGSSGQPDQIETAFHLKILHIHHTQGSIVQFTGHGQ